MVEVQVVFRCGKSSDAFERPRANRQDAQSAFGQASDRLVLYARSLERERPSGSAGGLGRRWLTAGSMGLVGGVGCLVQIPLLIARMTCQDWGSDLGVSVHVMV